MILVSYIFPTSHHYRVPFHQRLRELLAARNIDYRVVYCDPGSDNRAKGDTIDIPWGVKVGRTQLPGGIVYQHALAQAARSDLVIVQQENRLALNYLLQLASLAGLKKVAFFGHGRNFQSRSPRGPAERFKRFWATKVDWWFAYTEETRDHIATLGFPAAQATVFNNSVDTGELRAELGRVTPERLAARRRALGLQGRSVGLFVGGLYADKRLDFLISSAIRVRARIPDFELIVVGAGPAEAELRDRTAGLAWVKVTGAQFGQAKAEIMRLADLFLMPGLVGLAVLDAGVAGLPVVTTAFPYHSPEIAYLVDGQTGLIVPEWESKQAYADAIVGLLGNRPRLDSMSRSARETASSYTVEAMAERFAEGVIQCLGVTQRRERPSRLDPIHRALS